MEETVYTPANKGESNHWSVKLHIWTELRIFVTFQDEASLSSRLEVRVDKRHIGTTARHAQM